MSGFDPLGDLPAPDPPETEASELTDEEIAVTAAAVRAVVEHDQPALDAMQASGDGDPYAWTHEYGRWGDVHLVLPPGDPRTWTINVIRDGDWLAVEVDMWTREEGRSDLTLELELSRQPDGSLRAEFHSLDVM